MAVRLRLKRTGAKNMSCFRIVAMDNRSARDGKAIEELGFYDPRGKNENLNLERAEYWIGNGAAMSETVAGIVRRARAGEKLSDKQKPAKPSKKSLAKKEAEVKAVAEAKAKAEEEAKAAAEAKAKADAEAKAKAEEEAAKAAEAASGETAEPTEEEAAPKAEAEPAAE